MADLIVNAVPKEERANLLAATIKQLGDFVLRKSGAIRGDETTH